MKFYPNAEKADIPVGKITIEVCGGVMVFEDRTEYNTWRETK